MGTKAAKLRCTFLREDKEFGLQQEKKVALRRRAMLENFCIEEGSASGCTAQTDIFRTKDRRIGRQDRSTFENVC